MRRLLPFAAGLVLVSGGCQDTGQPLLPDTATPSAEVSGGGDAYVAGQILVQFAPGADRAQLAAAHGGSLKSEILSGLFVMKVPEGRELNVISALSHNPNVAFAEPDYLRQINALPSDKFFGYKWDLHNDGTLNNSTGAFVANTGKVDADIDWLEAYEQLGMFTGAAVIGILDTGVNPTHQDLAGRVLPTGYDFVNNDANPADDHGHGTHVAGIAAGAGNNLLGVSGVAYGPNIKILPVKICGSGSTGCPTSAIVSGIRYAADNGANVINLSIGGRFGSTSEQQALQYALSKNTLAFCASGNERAKSVSYPGAFPECVAVGATDWNDSKASYSNSGSALDISAPGGDSENRSGYSYILSADYATTDGYVFMAGTSMAAPEATGLGGLLHALGVTGASNIRSRIESTTDDLGSAGWDTSFGRGRINVYRAVNNLQ